MNARPAPRPDTDLIGFYETYLSFEFDLRPILTAYEYCVASVFFSLTLALGRTRCRISEEALLEMLPGMSRTPLRTAIARLCRPVPDMQDAKAITRKRDEDKDAAKDISVSKTLRPRKPVLAVLSKGPGRSPNEYEFLWSPQKQGLFDPFSVMKGAQENVRSFTWQRLTSEDKAVFEIALKGLTQEQVETYRERALRMKKDNEDFQDVYNEVVCLSRLGILRLRKYHSEGTNET